VWQILNELIPLTLIFKLIPILTMHRKIYSFFLYALLGLALVSCGSQDEADVVPSVQDESAFSYEAEKFADINVLRYQIPAWDSLTTKQKELVYYLTQAGLAGRDIMWDQNYRHNLHIRRSLEKIYQEYTGDKTAADWLAFETYLKQVWFSNGIHHHYSSNKHIPAFSKEYFDQLCQATGTVVNEEAQRAIFDPTFDAKKVEQDGSKGLVEGSAVNFYAPDVTTAEAQAYYESIIDKTSRTAISYGLNSQLAKDESGKIIERVWKSGGLYGAAIDQIIFWLEKAEKVAENDRQASAFRNLIEYYKTGSLETWDVYNINWVKETEGDIDYINGFVEVYNDPLGYKGTYENIVQITDFEASARMSVLMDNVQWFETNSPIMEQHKKPNVTGVTYKVVNVAGEAGDASPSTPIGVNLPNANWIRVLHGSKSVSLGNIVEAYDQASGSGMLDEFAHDAEEVERAKAHGAVAGKLHTALHEVVGHASGQIEEGVGTPKETIKEYGSTLEEGRADLVALYYMLDPTMVELGLMESLEVGKAEYDGYIRNGLLTQLRRLKPGEIIEEAHMRNRAWVSRWVLEKGAAENVIAVVQRDGKTYYDIQDYDKLRILFGDLLKEVQRIKSQGDYEAAKNLVENYGVQVDAAIHQEVLARSEKLNIPPYSGFVNPVLVPVTDESGNIIDVKVEYGHSFTEQMLYYSKNYSFLPEYN
jgi:dipeptidyl-peptidase-3